MHRLIRASANIVVMLAVVAGGGCALFPQPSPMKMDLLYDDRACPATQAPVLLVWLPGANMAPAELVQEGFVAALRQRGLAVDVMLADAHMGYVADGSMLRHLEDDIIGPARAAGYRRFWLAGISLGGFVAMGYALHHPGEIEGLVALAPYLGRRTLVQAIADAGGPAAWRQAALPRDDGDIDTAVWMWLSALPPGAPPIWLGYGSGDRFVQAHGLMAGLLPAERVSVVPGGHDWAPWRRLWASWLDRGLLPTHCAP